MVVAVVAALDGVVVVVGAVVVVALLEPEVIPDGDLRRRAASLMSDKH